MSNKTITLDDLENAIENSETVESSYRQRMIDLKLTVPHIASYFVRKYSSVSEFASVTSRLRKYLSSSGPLPSEKKECEMLEQEIGAYGLIRLMTAESVGRIGVYTPYNVTDVLHSRQVKIRYFKESGKDCVAFSGKNEVVQELIESYPKCDSKMLDFLVEMFPKISPELLPYDRVLARITRYCVTLFKFDIAGKKIIFNRLETFNELMGGKTQVFSRGVPTAGLEKIKQFLLGETGEAEMLSRMNLGQVKELDEWYRMVYRRCIGMPHLEKFVMLFDKLMTKDEVAIKKVALEHSSSIITASRYLEKHREVRGADQKAASKITRNSHLISSMPDAFSTAEKWNAPLEALAKILGNSKPPIVVAGCQPGHFIPVVRYHLPITMENVEDSVVEGIVVSGGDKTNATFVDLLPCPENSSNDRQWTREDVFKMSFAKDTIFISDAWGPACRTSEGQRIFCNRMILRILGHMLDRRGKTVKNNAPSMFAVKFVYGVPQGEKVSSKPNNWIPPGFETVFSQACKRKWFITQMGRPHNGEFVLTNYKINSKSFVPNTPIDASKKLSGGIILGNVRRFLAIWNPYPLTPLTLPKELFPAHSAKDMDLDSGLLSDLSSLLDNSKKVKLETKISIDVPKQIEPKGKKKKKNEEVELKKKPRNLKFTKEEERPRNLSEDEAELGESDDDDGVDDMQAALIREMDELT
jgi:hypothetical protein